MTQFYQIYTTILRILNICKGYQKMSCSLKITLFFIYIYLFLAALGLCCCARAFSSSGQQGLLFVVVHGFLIAVASFVVEHRLQVRGLQQLWHTSLAVLRHVGSSRTRDRTHVPCIGRWILNHCATREVLKIPFESYKVLLKLESE